MTTYLDSPFASSHKRFETLVSSLCGADAAQLDHGDLERLIETEGREVLRQLMQDHLDLRAQREEDSVAPVLGADGVARTEVRRGSRQLGTLFGDVGVRRIALVKRGAPGGLRPLDARLNLPQGKYSDGVVRQMAWAVSQSSYDTAVADLRRSTGAAIAKRQAEELTVRASRDFEDFYLHQPRQPVDDGHLVVLSFDGCGVVMRPEGLRAETRKRARNERRRSTAESAGAVGARQRGTRKNRKRMAEVAAVYELEAVSRTPEDVERELTRSGPHKPRPKPKNKRVWASLDHPVSEIIEDAFLEGASRDLPLERRWVAVVDGNDHQIRWTQAVAADYGVNVTIVVDFIHVLGYLWKAGKALVGDDLDAVDAWVAERSGRILRGQASNVAGGMRRSATRKDLRGVARKAVDECARYLLNHKDFLRYHEYLRDGLPIASGVIEGACRSLVRDRMDITGARWGLQGGEAVLKLRSLRASGDLDEYLRFHSRRELERNHLARFDANELLDIRAAA